MAQAHANLRVTQAILPNEAWGVLNQLHLWAAETRHEAVDRRTRLAWTGQLIRQCQLFSGLLEGTMSHDDTYAFLEIGRGLERADMTTRVLDVQAGTLVGQSDGASPYADLMWMGVLRSLSAHQMFRRIAGPMVSGPVALRFLLRDPQFPRSVERCLIENLTLLARAVPAQRTNGGLRRGPATARADRPRTTGGGPASAAALHDYADRLQHGLGRLHQLLVTTYFQMEPSTSTMLLPV